MAWSTNKTWSPGEGLTAALLNTYLRDQLDETAPAVATAGGRLIVTDGANSITERSVASARVATAETRTLTTYGALTTAGPAVSVTCGTEALVWITCDLMNGNAGAFSLVSVGISGATTRTGSDNYALTYQSSVANDRMAATYLYHATGLTAGSNTFGLKYKVSAGTGTFRHRYIAVLPL